MPNHLSPNCLFLADLMTFSIDSIDLSVINGAKIISNTEAGSLHVLVSTEQQTKMPMSCQNEFSEFKTENSEHENKQEILNIGIVKLEVAEANRGQLRITLII